jgi:ferritin-like metal-binding protein YciE
MTLELLLVKTLQDLYQSESEQTRRLAQLAHVAASPELRSALQEHLDATQQHVQRLSQVLEKLGETAGGPGEVPPGLQGLIAEAENRILEEPEGGYRDLAVIASARKMEHYEIAGYSGARAMAHTLDLTDEAHLLQDTISEEHQADERLTRIALTLLKQVGQKEASQA